MSITLGILSFFAIWFLISIPVTLFVGWCFSLQKDYDVSERDAILDSKKASYPDFKRLDGAS